MKRTKLFYLLLGNPHLSMHIPVSVPILILDSRSDVLDGSSPAQTADCGNTRKRRDQGAVGAWSLPLQGQAVRREVMSGKVLQPTNGPDREALPRAFELKANAGTQELTEHSCELMELRRGQSL